jgi:hypothetical protein
MTIEVTDIPRRVAKHSMARMKITQSLEQTFAHIGQHRRRRLTMPNDFRFGQINGGHLGKGAAEIDENCERIQDELKIKNSK